MFPPDVKKSDGHRECYTYTTVAGILGREPVDEFLHVLEDLFSHDEVWPQPYNHPYVSLRSERYVWKDLDVDADARQALQCDAEPPVEPEELKPLSTCEVELELLSTDKVVTADSHKPAARLDNAGNEGHDQSTAPDDLPEVDMDRPLRVTLAKSFDMPIP